MNNVSNEPKVDSINVSIDKGQNLNTSQLGQLYSNCGVGTNSLSQDNFTVVASSLKSSFKEIPSGKPELNLKLQVL